MLCHLSSLSDLFWMTQMRADAKLLHQIPRLSTRLAIRVLCVQLVCVFSFRLPLFPCLCVFFCLPSFVRTFFLCRLFSFHVTFRIQCIFEFCSLQGMLFFAVLILIGTGWSYMKPKLTSRDQNIVFAVILLQVCLNITQVILSEESPGSAGWQQWVCFAFRFTCLTFVIFFAVFVRWTDQTEIRVVHFGPRVLPGSAVPHFLVDSASEGIRRRFRSQFRLLSLFPFSDAFPLNFLAFPSLLQLRERWTDCSASDRSICQLCSTNI